MRTDRVSNFILADDHPLVRQGVRMVLEAEYADCSVTEAADLDTALEAIVASPDSILLIDLDMPGMDGTESLRALRQEFPRLLMAVLSGNANHQTISDALSTGVNGYILKASPPEDLLFAISTILAGHVYLGNVLWKPPADAETEAARAPQPESPELALTARQRQVAGWLMKGHSNKQLARDMGIGVGTVKIHLAAIFRALGVRNRTEAVMTLSRLQL